MSLRDELALDLLRADAREGGPGVTAADIARAAHTRWPESLIGLLRRRGYAIDLQGDRYRLYVDDPEGDE